MYVPLHHDVGSSMLTLLYSTLCRRCCEEACLRSWSSCSRLGDWMYENGTESKTGLYIMRTCMADGMGWDVEWGKEALVIHGRCTL